MTERRLKGVAAAAGVVVGRFQLHCRHHESVPDARLGDAAALEAALEAAARDLQALQEACTPEEAEILAMQVSLLSDEALTGPAFEAIGQGDDAATAWCRALDAEIEDYRAAEDPYFQARAADFEDIRDQVLERLQGRRLADTHVAAQTIVLADDLKPSEFLATRWAHGSGVALARGSPSSHVAMLARGRAVAMVVGLGDALFKARGLGVLDGAAGEVFIDPAERRLETARLESTRLYQRLARDDRHARARAVTADGASIAVHLTVAGPEELDGLHPGLCDGIGLVRTELFLDTLERLRDEEFQYACYRRIVQWAEGRPVVFRTADAGGDKPIAGYTLMGEDNPFLGMRGVRLSLANEAIFRVQLRALARAAAHGDVRIMLPMITLPRELERARALLGRETAALAAAGVAHACPPLGIMVEVPTVAITPERFEADFYSIGSNDLVQYVCAFSRGQAGQDGHAGLAAASDPAILALVAKVVAHGHERVREVGFCGDLDTDPALLEALLRQGVRSLSVPPASVGSLKARIAAISLAGTGVPRR